MAGPWDFTLRPMALPSESLMRGAALGGGIIDAIGQGQQIGQQRIAFQQAQDDRTALMQAQQAQAQKLAEEAARFKADQERLAANPYDIELRAELAARYPKVYGSPDFKAAFDGLDKANQKQLIDEFSQVHSAMKQGRADIAQDLLSQNQVAFENAGRMGEAQSRAKLAEMIDQDPELAFAWVTDKLASAAADQPEVLANLNKIDAREFEAQQAEAKAKKDAADAEKAAVQAKYEGDVIMSALQKDAAQIQRWEAQTKNEAARLGVDWANYRLNKLKAEAEPQKAAQKAVTEVEGFRQNIRDNIDALTQQIEATGTFELTGTESADMERRITSIATDLAKLKDPGSVAREGEVALEKKGLFPTGVGGLLTRNSTAIQTLKNLQAEVDKRADNAYRVRGVEPPAKRGGGNEQRAAAEAEADAEFGVSQ